MDVWILLPLLKGARRSLEEDILSRRERSSLIDQLNKKTLLFQDGLN